MSALGGVASVAKTKASIGLAVAALAAGTVVAAAAPSSHRNSDGSQQSNAQAFGQQVVAEVAACKAALKSGEHGIGKCVSAWVKAHNPGAAHRHSGSDTDKNGKNGSSTEGKSDDTNEGASGSHKPSTEGGSDDTHGSNGHGQSGSHGKH